MRNPFFLMMAALALSACGPKNETREAPTERATRPVQDIEQEAFVRARAEFRARSDARAKTLTDLRHAPLILDHGRPTRYVVIITPGLYDSAAGQKPLAERLHRRGFNVVVPLFPGHWDKDDAIIDRASYAEYVTEQEETVRIAKDLGKELILVGHSTGGLLALRTAIAEPRTAALIVSAPAFNLTYLTLAQASLGTMLGISGNILLGPKNGIDIPYMSAYAGEQVRKLIKLTRNQNGWDKNKAPPGETSDSLYRKLFSKVKVPTVLVTAGVDATIDNHVARLLPGAVQAPSLSLISPALQHFDVGRWPGMKEDTPKERAYALENKRLVDAAETFLASHLPDYGPAPERSGYRATPASIEAKPGQPALAR